MRGLSVPRSILVAALAVSPAVWAAHNAGAQSTTPAARKVRVACVGDSITFGTKLKNPAAESYPAQLAKMLGAKYDVRNFGVDGAGMINKGFWPYQKQQAFQDALKFNPDVVVIMLGTNDTMPTNWKFRTEFGADAKGLVNRFAALPSRPRVFIAYPLPVIKEFYGVNNPAVKALQPVIAAVATQTRTVVIDAYTPLADRPECFVDGVHPDATGAALLARTVFKALTTSPAEGAQTPDAGANFSPTS